MKKFSGYRFLRQHPVFYQIDKGWIDFFIADFYCYKLKLIIELDGEIHLSQKEYDKERDEKLKAKGLQVIRIDNARTEDLGKLKMDLEEIVEKRAHYLFTKNK
jgi:very-short-patch-repair endonuclease